MIQRFGRIEGGHFVEVVGASVRLLSGAPWVPSTVPSGVTKPLESVTWLTPSDASKVVCIGQNYASHAAEMGKVVPVEPLLFIKPSTALNAHGSPIRIPEASHEVHYEAELGLVIGTRLTRASEPEAEAAIFALTCFNDVTARDIQKRELQHTRAKSYDTFACCGPWMVRGVSTVDLRVQCRVNGQTRQDGRTSDMVHSCSKLVSFISQIMTLLPGDVVSTGTPSGVGALRAGDVVEVEVEHVGVLRNSVA